MWIQRIVFVDDMINCKKCHKAVPDESVYCMWCGRKLQQAERIKRRPNGTGSVYKMGGVRKKPWRAVVSRGKKRVTVGCFETQTQALKAIAAYELQGKEARNNMTLREVYDAWSDVNCDVMSDSAWTNHKSAWKRLSAMADLPITELKTSDYQTVIDEMKSSKSRSSCEKVRSLVSHLCKWAMQNDIIDRNYAQFLVLPPQKTETKRKYFTEQEIASLWAVKEEDTAKIVLVMIYTGMRINELFSLTIEDVHLDEEVAPDRKVSYVIGGEKTEAGKDRVIVLHSKILPFIREWMAQEGRRYLVEKNDVHTKRDDHNFRARDYYPLLDRLGIEKISPHKARHTFASRGAKAGIPTTVLQNIMGHEKYETTADYYTHVDILQLADGIEMIDK